VWVSFPFAARADPESAESMAALGTYVEGRFRKFPFRRAEVEAATRERVTLVPE
jgi:hypothetical protein